MDSATHTSVTEVTNNRAVLGILNRRCRWGLSTRGWLFTFGIVIAFGVTIVLGSYSFLAVTDRQLADILVVEGWINQFSIEAAANEFRRGDYQRVYITGGPVSGLGHYVNDYQTAASVGAGRLKAAGIMADRIQMVPSHEMGRDRTYSSAVALRTWFHERHLSPKAINVITESVHARRTRLLFQEAFGDEVQVGVIAIPNPDYDARHWWRYSEGVRDVIGETIAYVYARVFFHPSPGKNES